MPRSTRLLLILAILCIAFTLFVLSVAQASQTVIPTPSDIELTATHIIAAATQTRMALGTPIPSIPPEILAPTIESIRSTRTAIAVTRAPSLLTPSTPDSIELTATQIIAAATSRPATLTFEPNFYETVSPAPCSPSVGNLFQPEITSQIEQELKNAGLNITNIGVVTIVVASAGGCDSKFDPLLTFVSMQVIVDDNFSDEHLAQLTVDILAVLTKFPPQNDFGKVVRLNILFEPSFSETKGRTIETDYTNAIKAYEENLRGQALIEALGGLWDVGLMDRLRP